MKLTKPFNQLRSLLQHVASRGGYRVLSIIMTAILFFGANNQIMAASVPIGANYAADMSAPASGDRFNGAALLKESAPAGDNQPLTFTQKIEAGIAGVAALGALSYGGFRAYKYYSDRNRSGSEDEIELSTDGAGKKNETTAAAGSRKRALSDDKTGNGDVSDLSKRGESGRSAVDNTLLDKSINFSGIGENQPTSRWTNAKVACAAWGQRALDLVTLKDCRGAAAPVVEVEKSFSEHLADTHTADQNTAVKALKDGRTWGKTVQDLFMLKQHKAEDTRTAMQKGLTEANRLKAVAQGQLSYNQMDLIIAHKGREARFAALTVKSTPEEIFATLDPEMREAVMGPLEKYSIINPSNSAVNKDCRVQFLYFVAKNHDSLTPGKLASLDAAFPQYMQGDGELWDKLTQEVSLDAAFPQYMQGDGELWDKLTQEVEKLWQADSDKLEKTTNPFGKQNISLNSLENSRFSALTGEGDDLVTSINDNNNNNNNNGRGVDAVNPGIKRQIDEKGSHSVATVTIVENSKKEKRSSSSATAKIKKGETGDENGDDGEDAV